MAIHLLLLVGVIILSPAEVGSTSMPILMSVGLLNTALLIKTERCASVSVAALSSARPGGGTPSADERVEYAGTAVHIAARRANGGTVGRLVDTS